ncbi:unnamed protein product, partial [Prorocentrum cordatum]
GLLGILDRWGVPALRAWVSRCPAIDVPPFPACPGCPPCPGATAGAAASSVAFACLAACLAGAAFGALGAIAALRLSASPPSRRARSRRRLEGLPRAWRWRRSRMAETRAWVLHDVAGARLFHQRRLAGQLALADDVVAVAPDDVVYAEIADCGAGHRRGALLGGE